MDKLENDTRGIELTPEFVDKSDKDIATISALNEYASQRGIVLVLTGGYATEALCGGKVARPHGDIDLRLLIPDLKQSESVFSDIKKILETESTKWVLRQQGEDKLEYLEDAPEKEFFEKRRVELKLRKKGSYPVKLEDGILVDSRGFTVKVKTIRLLDLVSSKIHKFYEMKDGVDISKDRHSSESDYFDLDRLLSLPQLEKKQIVDTLARSKDLRELSEPVKQAVLEYDYTSRLLDKHFNR